MEGRSSEFSPEVPELPQNEAEPTDDGFSEKRLARIAEGKTADKKVIPIRKPLPVVSNTQRVVRIRPVVAKPPLSIKDKIIAAYKRNASHIIKLVESLYVLDGANIRQEEQIHTEIKERRRVQEELVTALILEQKHQLTQDAISKEAWNLIK